MKIFKTKKYSILSGILKYSFVIVFGVVILSNICLAGPGYQDTGDTPGFTDPDTSGTNITTKIQNPLGEDGPKTIPEFIEKIIRIVLVVGVPIAALAIIYTGFLFVAAQGNSEKLTVAKRSLLYTIIGTTLLLGAFVIGNAIGETVDDITSTT